MSLWARQLSLDAIKKLISTKQKAISKLDYAMQVCVCVTHSCVCDTQPHF